MDDATNRESSSIARSQKHNEHRHLQTDMRSVGMARVGGAYRPYLSLKARMLGGHAEMIRRLGVKMR